MRRYSAAMQRGTLANPTLPYCQSAAAYLDQILLANRQQDKDTRSYLRSQPCTCITVADVLLSFL
jgi:hypothetical protein